MTHSKPGSPMPRPAAEALQQHLDAGPKRHMLGGLLGLLAEHGAQVLQLDGAAQDSAGLAEQVRAAVGPPHNYQAHAAVQNASGAATAVGAAASPQEPQSSTAATELSAEVGQVPMASDGEQQVQLQYQREVAVQAAPLARVLAREVAPHLARALSEAAAGGQADPIRFIGQRMLEAAGAMRESWRSPYAAETYGAQKAKWEAKEQRQASREAVAAIRRLQHAQKQQQQQQQEAH